MSIVYFCDVSSLASDNTFFTWCCSFCGCNFNFKRWYITVYVNWTYLHVLRDIKVSYRWGVTGVWAMCNILAHVHVLLCAKIISDYGSRPSKCNHTKTNKKHEFVFLTPGRLVETWEREFKMFKNFFVYI